VVLLMNGPALSDTLTIRLFVVFRIRSTMLEALVAGSTKIVGDSKTEGCCARALTVGKTKAAMTDKLRQKI